jgi:hypothetical protein
MLLELVVGLTLAQPAPVGSDFAVTFTPDAVASYLEGRVAYLVVGAGKPTPALLSAAAALEEALRAGGKAELVMNGASLGPVVELDDPALVARCESLPVARVAVVRTFEAEGEAPRAVVTVYDKKSKVLVAFTAQAGKVLASGRHDAAAAGLGVPSSLAQSVLRAEGGEAQDEYNRSYVEFTDVTAVTQAGAVFEWTMVHQGKQHARLEGDAFYRLIGRDDLATQYRSNEATRTGFIVAGVAIAVALPLLAFASRSQKDCGSGPSVFDPNFQSASDAWFKCTQDNDSATSQAMVLGGIGGALGVGIAVLGANFVHLHPVDASEARRLGEEYNKKLKARLGLASAGATETDATPEPAPSEPGVSLSLSLVPTVGGGMVGLGITF